MNSAISCTELFRYQTVIKDSGSVYLNLNLSLSRGYNKIFLNGSFNFLKTYTMRLNVINGELAFINNTLEDSDFYIKSDPQLAALNYGLNMLRINRTRLSVNFLIKKWYYEMSDTYTQTFNITGYNYFINILIYDLNSVYYYNKTYSIQSNYEISYIKPLNTYEIYI